MFHALQRRATDLVPGLQPPAVATVLWAFATAGHYHEGFIAVLAGRAADSMERFTPRALSMALWACGRLRHFDAPLLSAARLRAMASAADFEPQALSNTAWALARLGVRDEALMGALARAALGQLPRFSVQGLANLAWAAAASGCSCARALVRACCAAAAAPDAHPSASLASARPQEVANLLWAAARLRLRDEQFLSAACRCMAAAAGECAPADLAQAAWALGTLRFIEPPLARALRLYALNRLHVFNHQQLCNLTWGLAALRLHDDALAAAAARQARALLPGFSPQGLSTLLWSLSRLGCHDRELLHAAAPVLARLAPTAAPQDLSNAAWAAAAGGFHEASLFGPLCAAAAARCSNSDGGAGGAMGAQALVNTAWACARARYADAAFLRAAGARGAALLAQGALTGQWLASLVASTVQLGAGPSDLMDAVAAPGAVALAELPARSLAQLVAAYVMHAQQAGEAAGPQQEQQLECRQALQQHQVFVAALLAELATRQVEDVGCPLVLCQLHQARLLLEAGARGAPSAACVCMPAPERCLCSETAAAAAALPSVWQLSCRAAWQDQEAGCPSEEARREAARALQRLGLAPELLRWQGQALVPLGVSWRGQRIAVCFVPEEGVMALPASELVGHVRLQHACLRAAGWRVAAVQLSAWQRLHSQLERRQALEDALEVSCLA